MLVINQSLTRVNVRRKVLSVSLAESPSGRSFKLLFILFVEHMAQDEEG